MSGRRRAKAAILCAVFGAATLSACDGPLRYAGCSARDQQLVPQLTGLAILGRRPAGTVRVNSYAGCDPEGALPYAGRYYQGPHTRPEIQGFYRDAAPADGWRTTGPDCYAKAVGGVPAYMRIWFPQRTTENFRYGLELTAGTNGTC